MPASNKLFFSNAEVFNPEQKKILYFLYNFFFLIATFWKKKIVVKKS